MVKFRIRYDDPETGEPRTRDCEFEDWTGRATFNGEPVGPEISITAREWAEDLGYSLADKGRFMVFELLPSRD